MVPYSPENVQKYCKLYHLWNLVTRKMLNRRVSTRLIRRQAKACGVLFPIRMNIEDVKEQPNKAIKEYIKAKPSAKEKRERFIENLAATYEKRGEDKAAAQVKDLTKQEDRREAQREVKNALNPKSNAKILHVGVADAKEEGGVRYIYEKNEMESEVMKDHIKKYTEYNDTPSLMEPLKTILGPFGLTAACDLILQGKYKLPPVVHPDIVEFFENVKMKEEIIREPPVSVYQSVENYKKYWKYFRKRVM